MNKLTFLFALTTLAFMGLSAGLWYSSQSDSTGRVVELETKLREAEATIAKLQKQTAATAPRVSGSSRTTHVSSVAGTIAGADASSPQATPAGTQPMTTAGNPGAPSSVGTVTTPPAVTDPRTLKSLAEAEAKYADLISQFQLQPDEKEFFKQLAAKRSEVRKRVVSQLQDPSLTPAQRQALLVSGKTELDANDAEMRQFLNNDTDYQKFALWENTEIERAQLEAGRAIFQNNGAPLNTEQEDWLVQNAFALRSNTKGVADPFNADSMVGVTVDQNYMNTVMQKFDADTNLLLQNARSRFTQAQLDAVKAWRQQQRVQVESRLWNMSRTMGTTR
ncbi:MAG: hypothetical protein JNM99_16625 [Verrucomicrobiaceae bacterium]|nr:hypothetical protein [Verrucomicrobiaceae bacterium]